MLLEDACTSVVSKAALRLINCQEKAGWITYISDASTGKESNLNYNMVRLAGVLYSLCSSTEQLTLESEIGRKMYDASSRLIQFIQFSVDMYDGDYVRDYKPSSGFSNHGKLGATALSALALTFSPFREEHSDLLLRLIRSIYNLQSQNGLFRTSHTDPSHIAGQRYAPGEAILALVRFAEKTGEVFFLNKLHTAFDFYARYYSMDPHPGFLLWHIDAWSRAARMTNLSITERKEYCTFAQNLADQIVVHQKCGVGVEAKYAGGISFQGHPGISTSLYMEALVRTTQMLDECSMDADRYRQATELAAPFVRSLQITPQQVTQCSRPERFIGAFRMNPDSWHLRMDNDQHAITAFLALNEVEPSLA